jgi:hypothetical protein
VACLSERAIIVTHGRDKRIVSRIDPTRTDSGAAASNGSDTATTPETKP